jgi:hypothetical protein
LTVTERTRNPGEILSSEIVSTSEEFGVCRATANPAPETRTPRFPSATSLPIHRSADTEVAQMVRRYLAVLF